MAVLAQKIIMQWKMKSKQLDKERVKGKTSG